MPGAIPRDERGWKWCGVCRDYRDPATFPKSSKYRDGLDYLCKPCANERVRKARAADPARFKEYERRHLAKPGVRDAMIERKRRYRAEDPERAAREARRGNLRRYRLTPEQFDALAAAQDGLCAICRGAPMGKGNRLHVDHDHSSGRVRALLCSHCNVMLGAARDRVDLLHAAIAYLARSTEVVDSST